MKKISLIMILLLFSAGMSFAQQLTTVAIIDAQRVYDSFTKGNNLSAGINAIQLRYQEQINAQLVTIQQLEGQKRSTSDRTQIRDIDSRISAARAEIDRLDRLRTQETRAQRQFVSPNVFIPELQRAVIFVAESKGYTIVLNAEDEGLQWWSPIVDITDDVIARLISQLSR